jgi:hypothetical protein
MVPRPPRAGAAARASVPILILLALAVFALGLTRFTIAGQHASFDRDEARWIYHAGSVRHLLQPLGSAWADDTVNRDQPPLAGYVLGAGLALQGESLHTVGWWNMSKSRAWNTKHGNMPARAELFAARRVNALVGALAAAALFLLVARLTNPIGGLAASLALIAHPLMTQLASRADSDALLVLLVLLTALAGVWLAERPTWPRAVLLGTLLGLGGADKLTPLGIAAGLGVLGALLVVWSRFGEAGSRERRLGWRLLIQPAVAVAVFVAVSPYLWRNPLRDALNLYDFREHEMSNQRRIWPTLAIRSPLDLAHRVWKLLGMQMDPTGWAIAEARRFVPGQLAFPGLDLALGLAGLALLAWAALRWGPTSPAMLAACVIGGEAALALVGMRVYFARYLMPVALALTVGLGILAGTLWSWAAAWLSARPPAPAPAAPTPAAGERA